MDQEKYNEVIELCFKEPNPSDDHSRFLSSIDEGIIRSGLDKIMSTHHELQACFEAMNKNEEILKKFKEALKMFRDISYAFASESGLEIDQERIKALSIIKAKSLNIYGATLRGLGQHEEALVYYVMALEVLPENSIIMANIIHTLLDHYPQSSQRDLVLSELVKYDFENSNFLFLKGLYFFHTNNNFEQDIINFDKALELESSSTQIKAKSLNYKVNCFLELDQYEEALQSFNAVSEIDPEYKYDSQYSNTWLNRARLFHQYQDFTKALEFYFKALEIAPNDWVVLYNIGNAYYSLERYQEASKYYEQACELKPEHPFPYSNFGHILIKAGKYAEALECFNTVLIFDIPESLRAETLLDKSCILSKMNNPQEALEYFKEAFSINFSHKLALEYREVFFQIKNQLQMSQFDFGGLPESLVSGDADYDSGDS